MATFKRLLAANSVERTETEASAECTGWDWRREMFEELAWLSAAWTGYPLFPRSCFPDEQEGQDEQ